MVTSQAKTLLKVCFLLVSLLGRLRRQLTGGRVSSLLPYFIALNNLIVGAAAIASTGGASPAITPESIRAHHQALVDISSRAGGFDSGVRLNEAGEATAQYLLQGYEDAGLENVRLEPFYPNRWWPEDYSLTMLGNGIDEDIPLTTFPVWYSEKANNLELEVVYAGYGTPGELRGLDVEGKAVLIDMKRMLHFVVTWHPELTDAMTLLKERGALAIITAETRIETPSGIAVGDPGTIRNLVAQEAKLFPLPVLAVGKRDGQRLKDRIGSGKTLVRMNLHYSLERTKSHNVVAELPGNGKVDEYIVIGGHYDTWFTGAIDNLGSQAALLEMARYFSQVPQRDRDRHMIFVALFGHELANHAMGQAAFVENRQDILGKVTCFLNVDGSGSWGWEERGDSGEIYPTNRHDKAVIGASSNALAALAYEAIYDHYPDGTATWFQFPLNFFVSDQHENIGESGIPTLLLISKHIYYHSTLDTIDRIAPDQVYRRTMANIDIAHKLLDSPAGYYISIDINPYRVLEPGDQRIPDLKPHQLPANPHPWQEKPPSDLDMHVIPAEPGVFSPVIAWSGFWTADAITHYDQVHWDFGGILDLLGYKNGFYAGTMYLFPGKKTVSMSVTDSKGRTSTTEREITVVAGRYAVFYWLIPAVLLIAVLKFVRKFT
jgi:hypothetical protein